MSSKEYYDSISERPPESSLWGREDGYEKSKSWLSKSELLANVISEIPADLRQLTVHFLNSVSTALDIRRLVQDAPHYGNQAGYGIGSIVAQRILDKRASLPQSKFWNLYDLNNIKGFSHDKLTDLVWSVHESYELPVVVIAEPEIEHEPLEICDIEACPEAQNNNANGLWWLNKNGAFFKVQRPTIIFIHGASGVPTWANQYWQSNRFLNWNAGVFNWSDWNWPRYAYGHKAHELYTHLVKMIRDYGYNNKEIRLAGYSWGMHVASYAAAKLVKYINEPENSHLKILVSVDLLDPINMCGYVKDNEGNERWGDGHVTTFLNYVAANQVVGIKPNKKLFTFVIEKYYTREFDGAEVLKKILPAIYHHAEVFQDGETHCNFGSYQPPPTKYKECDWQAYDETKIDLNNPVYVPGPDSVFYDWVEWWKHNVYRDGPCQKLEGPYNMFCRVWGGIKSRYW
ncbi:MAG: hypothetical protein ACFFCW_15560 [Candidatus Hodarchaeota archaeon]